VSRLPLPTTLLCFLLAAPSGAAQLYGPYRAEIVRVVDGDTLEMDIDLWPSLHARSMLRIKGLDTPELRGSACERSLAQRARDYLATLAIGTAQVDLVEPDKFGGRIDARVMARGVDLVSTGPAGPPRPTW
jgi:endonuclease YncB( thermonuclease family)